MAYPIKISDKFRRSCILKLSIAHEERRQSTLHVNGISAPFASLPGLRPGVTVPIRSRFGKHEMRTKARCPAGVLFDRRAAKSASSEVRELSLAHPLLEFGFDQDGKPFPL
jgi:hypothetical protein